MNYGIEYLVPVTIAVVEVIKRTGVMPGQFLPLLSLVLGAGLGYFAGLTGLDLLVVGLAASGLYDLGKEPVRQVVDRIRG